MYIPGRWPQRALAVTALLAAIALGCTARDDVPLMERRAQEIEKGIMCPVCPGESIDQSQHPLAAQMRAIVAEKLDQGWTEKQIDAFFVERYGPSVLMDPPREGINLAVWLVPPVGVATALLLLYLALRSMLRSRAVGAEGPDEIEGLSEEERADYFNRIEAALDDRGGDGVRRAADRPPDSDARVAD
jgi:cytochrome c-type biogenesis protein CcmH